jgi:flap endonuclease-1
MGIKNLSKLIGDNAAGGVREQEMASYFGRKVAIDASMTIYQFMVRSSPPPPPPPPLTMISNPGPSHIFSCDFSENIFFLLQIAVRSGGGDDQVSQQLTNEKGEVTSHLQGMFYRTIRMLTHGIKPCFVFDGKPPVLKSGELAKRKENREKAAEDLKKAEEADNKEDIDKVSPAPYHPHPCVFAIGSFVTLLFIFLVCL